MNKIPDRSFANYYTHSGKYRMRVLHLTQATQQIAAALNLTGKDLLSVDPMKESGSLCQNSCMQQMVEQIQTVVASSGWQHHSSGLKYCSIYCITSSTVCSDSENNLTSTATISAAISATVEAVKADLSSDIQNNLENVKTNLAALSAEVISSNVQSVETAIHRCTCCDLQCRYQSIKNETKAAVTEAKESVAAEKIVTILAPVLTQAPTQLKNH